MGLTASSVQCCPEEFYWWSIHNAVCSLEGSQGCSKRGGTQSCRMTNYLILIEFCQHGLHGYAKFGHGWWLVTLLSPLSDGLWQEKSKWSSSPALGTLLFRQVDPSMSRNPSQYERNCFVWMTPWYSIMQMFAKNACPVQAYFELQLADARESDCHFTGVLDVTGWLWKNSGAHWDAGICQASRGEFSGFFNMFDIVWGRVWQQCKSYRKNQW